MTSPGFPTCFRDQLVKHLLAIVEPLSIGRTCVQSVINGKLRCKPDLYSLRLYLRQ